MESPKNRYILGDCRPENMCRFCGCEDKENVNIFLTKKTPSPTSSQSEKTGIDDLLSKISTVYPFVLYENDPLPQHICPKCVENVYSLYRDIQEVLRHQKKLLNMLRTEEPQHEYFRILNEIENSSRSTKLFIKASYSVDINQNTPIKMLTFPSSGDLISDESSIFKSNDKIKLPPNEKLVQNIQTKLELNGCTIKRVKISQNETRLHPSIDSADDVVVDVDCPYCERKFVSEKQLAEHQVEHLNISSYKLFEKRQLPKHLRRGRLICVNNEKNIRCLNCWQVFKDNKSILQHWSNSDCYYYCFICGKEFPHSPKVLREHMPSAHGISFRSIMKQFYLNRVAPTTKLSSLSQTSSQLKLPQLVMSSNSMLVRANPIPRKKKRYYYKDGKSSTKNPDGSFSCNICHKVFSNYRSSNSHMRIHNIPDLYARRVTSKNCDELLLPDFPQTSNSMKKLTPPAVPLSFRTAQPSPMYPSSRPSYKEFSHNMIVPSIPTKHSNFMGNNSSSSWKNMEHHTPQRARYETDDSELLFPTLKEDLECLQATVKSEPIDDINAPSEFSNQWKCFICHETFGTSKEYNMHAMFVHNISE